ncbi:MAG: hypothetical protein ACLUE0_01075 [Bacteroides uniformis]
MKWKNPCWTGAGHSHWKLQAVPGSARGAYITGIVHAARFMVHETARGNPYRGFSRKRHIARTGDKLLRSPCRVKIQKIDQLIG